jgi:cyclase
MVFRQFGLSALIVIVGAVPVLSQSLPAAPKRVDVASGIHLFITPPYGDVGLDGNSVAIVGSNGVLVFDTNGTPAAAAAVLAEIRKLTKQPVKYVVHSHWHWDHWYGAEVYKNAFPGVQVISHEKTRQLMAGPAIEFNRPGLENGLPGYVNSLEERVREAERKAPPATDLPQLKERLATARFFLEEKRRVKHVLADRTFKDRLVLQLGDREVQVRNAGRAVTPGDAYLYLPKERILVTGDLLVNPVSFALSSYPTEWLKALEALDALNASIIVPGHGEPLRDESLLHTIMEVMRVLLREGKLAHTKGLTPAQARDAVMPILRDLMVKITRDEPRHNDAFKTYLVYWYLHRVFDELRGPLTDAIAPIPGL